MASEKDFQQLIANQDAERQRKEVANESVLGTAGRIATQYTSRAGEAIAGIPGAIEAAGKHVGGLAGEKLRETFGMRPLNEQEKGEIHKRRFPTSSELREKSEKLTKGYTKPRGPWEEFGGEIISDVAPMVALPGGASVARSVATATLGNTAKEIVKQFGGSEGTQELTKLGTMFIGGSINPGAARQATRQAYQTRDALIPQGATVSSTNLERALTQIENRAARGGGGPGTAEIENYITRLRARAQNGRIPVDELTEAKVRINQNRARYGFNRDSRRLYNDIAHAVDDELRNYGNINPAFYNAHFRADRMHETVERSLEASRQIADFVRGPIKSAVGTLIGYSYPKALVAGGVAYGGARGYAVLDRIMRNADLRRLYQNMLTESARNNAPAAAKSLEKLDKAYLKIYPDDKAEENIDFEQFRKKS